MDASYAVPTQTTHVVALIGFRHDVPITVAPSLSISVNTSLWRAHPVNPSDVHPAECAAGRLDQRTLATWHGDCMPLLGTDCGDRIAMHRARRRRSRGQFRRATRNLEKGSK
jgi:hypothetical protein